MTETTSEHRTPAVWRVTETCVGAGLAAGLLVWFGLFPLLQRTVGWFPSTWVDSGGFGISASGLGIGLVVLAMLAAVRWRFAAVLRVDAFLARVAAGLVGAVVVSIPLVTGFAASQHFDVTPEVIAVEVVIVAVVLSVSLRLALGVHRDRAS